RDATHGIPRGYQSYVIRLTHEADELPLHRGGEWRGHFLALDGPGADPPAFPIGRAELERPAGVEGHQRATLGPEGEGAHRRRRAAQDREAAAVGDAADVDAAVPQPDRHLLRARMEGQRSDPRGEPFDDDRFQADEVPQAGDRLAPQRAEIPVA